MNTLERYLARTLIGSTLLVLVVLMALNAFVVFIAELEDVGEGRYGLVLAMFYVLLRTPQAAYEIFPIAVLLGALFGLGALAANRELIVMRAAGMSVVRIAVAALKGGVLLMVLCVLLGDLLAPAAETYARDMRAAAQAGEQATVRVDGHLWLRDGDHYINIERLPAAGLADGVRFYRLEDGRLVAAARADRARFSGDGWALEGFAETRFEASGTIVQHGDSVRWQTHIDPDIVSLFVVAPESLTIPGLARYINYLEGNDLDTGAYEVALWNKIVAPVTTLVMVLLAVPFVFGPLRSAGAGQRLVIGVMVGIGYYAANTMLVGSGQVWGLPPALTAWAPTVILALVAGWAIRRVY